MISIDRVNNTSSSELNGLMLGLINSSIIKESTILEESVTNFVKEQTDYIFEAKVIGNDDKKKKEMSEKQKNIFDKIGQAAIEISKKIAEFIQKVINTIKDLGFRLKSDEKKLEAIKKRNPKYADAVICKLTDSDLSISDLKGLSDVDKLYKEIIDLSKKKEVDASTLRGKATLLKEKLKNADKSAAVTTAKAASAIIGVATGLMVIRKHKIDIEKSNADLQKKQKESYDEFLKAYNQLKEFDKSGEYTDSDILSKAQIIQNVHSMYQGKISSLVSANEKSFNKVSGALHTFCKKFDNAGKLISSLDKDLEFKGSK